MPKKLLIVSMSPIARDPRVLRQAALAREAGYDLSVIGFGKKGDPVPGHFIPLDSPVPGWKYRAIVAARQLPAWVSTQAALTLYWTTNGARVALDAAREIAPDLVHANDWSVLPIAAALGQRFIYDSHEFATGEQEDRLLWRIVFAPYVRAIEAEHIRHARRVLTVSNGIAERLRDLYSLQDLPVVVRNVPPFVDMPIRAVQSPIRVLYQGAYNPDRGLEELIDSVSLWRPEFTLTLRGIGNADYLQYLRARAASSSAADRISFAEPVKPSELVSAANLYDVGIHPIPPVSVQTDYCLPNKFFEYAMAGLCLCVSPAREMASLVTEYDMGVVMKGTRASDIADAVNLLSMERIAAAKKASHEAARTFNWARERERLLSVYQESF